MLTTLMGLSEGVVMADYSGKIPAADAEVELKAPDRSKAGPNEIDPGKALELAFANRPDFRNTLERVEDAQRAVLIAEDSLRGEVTLGGSASIGEGRGAMSGNQPDGSFRATRGSYGGLLKVDPRIECTTAQSRRNSLISLEKVVRTRSLRMDRRMSSQVARPARIASVLSRSRL